MIRFCEACGFYAATIGGSVLLCPCETCEGTHDLCSNCYRTLRNLTAADEREVLAIAEAARKYGRSVDRALASVLRLLRLPCCPDRLRVARLLMGEDE